MKNPDPVSLVSHVESAHDVTFYKVGGQKYFPMYGASGGLSTDFIAYIKPASQEWKLPADDMGTCSESPGFKVERVDGVPFVTVRWPNQYDPAELFLRAITAMKQHKFPAAQAG